jgi:hypothetical protein
MSGQAPSVVVNVAPPSVTVNVETGSSANVQSEVN